MTGRARDSAHRLPRSVVQGRRVVRGLMVLSVLAGVAAVVALVVLILPLIMKVVP